MDWSYVTVLPGDVGLQRFAQFHVPVAVQGAEMAYAGVITAIVVQSANPLPIEHHMDHMSWGSV